VTYLELCQDLVGQFGLSGGTGPTTVAGQAGELLNVTRWIRDACLYVENLWEDWRFHWTEYSGTCAINTNQATAPVAPAGVVVRTWKLNSIKIRKTGSGGAFERIPFLRWEDFSGQYDPATDAISEPAYCTIAPDDTLRFNCRVVVAYDVKGEFWRMPVALTVDGDMPLIPKAYHRIIVCRAVVMYADREDAPELVSGCGAEYIDMLDKLEGLALPGSRHRRQSMDHGDQASGEE
jgi:hypothetical protein